MLNLQFLCLHSVAPLTLLKTGVANIEPVYKYAYCKYVSSSMVVPHYVIVGID